MKVNNAPKREERNKAHLDGRCSIQGDIPHAACIDDVHAQLEHGPIYGGGERERAALWGFYRAMEFESEVARVESMARGRAAEVGGVRETAESRLSSAPC